ncbi:MAG TPA: hypothetical protein VGN20_28365 [Mucilaginibacter sp.]|jgi:hypothetical protein
MPFEVVDIEIQNDFQNIKIPAKFKINDNKVYLKKQAMSFILFLTTMFGIA